MIRKLVKKNYHLLLETFKIKIQLEIQIVKKQKKAEDGQLLSTKSLSLVFRNGVKTGKEFKLNWRLEHLLRSEVTPRSFLSKYKRKDNHKLSIVSGKELRWMTMNKTYFLMRWKLKIMSMFKKLLRKIKILMKTTLT